jgi:hypothetical protein
MIDVIVDDKNIELIRMRWLRPDSSTSTNDCLIDSSLLSADDSALEQDEPMVSRYIPRSCMIDIIVDDENIELIRMR